MLSAALSGRRCGANQLVNVRNQVVVREHDSLGKASCAAGVGKSGESFSGRLAGRRAAMRSRVRADRRRLCAGGRLARAVDAAKVR